MKKVFYSVALAAIVSIASSCTQSEVINQPKQAFSFNTGMGKMSKAPIDGTTYPITSKFGVFSYALTGTNNWANDALISSLVMNNVEIAYNGGGTTDDKWRATAGSFYWPNDLDTKISFFAYSPYKATGVAYHLTDGITFADFVNDGTVDLMYANDELDQTYTTNVGDPGTVNAVFNHALTQVLFTVKQGAAYPGVTITVKSIVIHDVISKGTFAAKGVPQWTLAADALNYTIYDDATGQGTTTTAAAIGSALVMIPQELTAVGNDKFFTIVYDITGTGVAAETVTRTVYFTGDWARNQRITYNLTINLREILFNPSVTDWALSDSDIDV